MSAKSYMIGNWKMNQSLDELTSFFTSLKDAQLKDADNANFWIAPQLIHVSDALRATENTLFKIGSQTISENDNGAFTGETSAKNLKELGAHFTLIGHSERRALFNETDSALNLKAKKALENNLKVVFCCGETLEQREEGKTLDIVLNQITNGLRDIADSSNIIIAYEPVWAIGTGKTASPDQAEEVHSAIRGLLTELFGDAGKSISILYGGSVKPANVVELLGKPNINGGLVGGASLKADSFAQLCQAL